MHQNVSKAIREYVMGDGFALSGVTAEQVVDLFIARGTLHRPVKRERGERKIGESHEARPGEMTWPNVT